MKIPKWLIGLGLAVLLVLIGGTAGYSQVAVTGYVVFNDGVTMEEALAAMAEYNTTLVQYTSAPGASEIGIGGFFEGVFDAASLADDFWRQYAWTMDDELDFIVRTDANPKFSKFAKWPAQKAAILAEIIRFDANEDGCWDRADCPSFGVQEFEIRAPISVLQTMENDPLILEVGWAAKYLLQAQNDEDPRPGTWVPSATTITGAAHPDEDGVRTLKVEFGWEEAGDLAFFKTGSTVYRGGVTLDVAGGNYYTTTKTFFGHRRLAGKWEYKGVARPYLPLADQFSGDGRADWNYGSLKAEDFEPDKIYRFIIPYASGLADDDTGGLSMQVGTRSCRLLFCISWHKGLILEGAKIVMPGTSEYLMQFAEVFMPNVMRAAVITESNQPQ